LSIEFEIEHWTLPNYAKVIVFIFKIISGRLLAAPRRVEHPSLLLCVSWVLLPLHSRYADNRIEAISLDLE
jgi:hypothetical protein